MSLSCELDIPQALIARYNQIGSTSRHDAIFCTSVGIDADDYAAALVECGQHAESLATLYVHLPFCPVRCLNCNNNASITHDSAEIEHYLDMLEREVSLLTDTLGTRRKVQQLHLGGGSPNYLSDRQLVRLMAILDRHFALGEYTEASLDANPKQTSRAQLTLLHGLGFRGIGFGVRDLDPGVQLAIGRIGSLEMLRDIFETARDIGFETLSTDILYGLPRQTPESIERTVDNLLALAPDRVICMPFTRRTAERAHQRAIDPRDMPSLADKLALFNDIVQGLTPEYAWIGLDSFAKHDDALSRAQSEHRLRKNWIGYTHLPPTELYGFGTSAISDLDGFCVQNHLEIPPWQQALDEGLFPIRGGVRLNTKDNRRRTAIAELMCNMELRDYADLFDPDDELPAAWSGYARDGLLSITPDCVSITPQGRYLLHQLWSGTAGGAAVA